MTKRRITKQQQLRINQRQNKYQQDNSLNPADCIEGLVISSFNKELEVEGPQGKKIRCSLRPHIQTLVAGDRVTYQSLRENRGVILSLLPRTTLLARPTRRGAAKPTAANLTQLIIVVTSKPAITWPLLDSYLVMAEMLQLKALILVNKTDLECEHLKATLLKDYQPLGYPLLFTTLTDKNSYHALGLALKNEVSVFVGQSGVGKSSLIAGILPEVNNISINAISQISELGKHTTSNSRYYHLPEGGALIDSPGIREFCLWSLDRSQLAQGYREFRSYIPLCKFRNCPHKATPHCAIIQAVTEGHISEQRYANFLKLLDAQA